MRRVKCQKKTEYYYPCSSRQQVLHDLEIRLSFHLAYTVYGMSIHIYMCFFTLQHFFLFRPRVFPRALGSVARPDAIRKFGPRPRSVARALGVQSGTSARGDIPST